MPRVESLEGGDNANKTPRALNSELVRVEPEGRRRERFPRVLPVSEKLPSRACLTYWGTLALNTGVLLGNRTKGKES